MILHHRQATEMTALALDRATAAGPDIVDLANRIGATHTAELELMAQWLDEWAVPSVGRPSDGHGGEMSADAGMVTAQEMATLRATRGAEFDQMWLEMMIRHHEGAVEMANAHLADGSNPKTLTLAAKIVATQRAEIDEMKARLPAKP